MCQNHSLFFCYYYYYYYTEILWTYAHYMKDSQHCELLDHSVNIKTVSCRCKKLYNQILIQTEMLIHVYLLCLIYQQKFYLLEVLLFPPLGQQILVFLQAVI